MTVEQGRENPESVSHTYDEALRKFCFQRDLDINRFKFKAGNWWDSVEIADISSDRRHAIAVCQSFGTSGILIDNKELPIKFPDSQIEIPFWDFDLGAVVLQTLNGQSRVEPQAKYSAHIMDENNNVHRVLRSYEQIKLLDAFRLDYFIFGTTQVGIANSDFVSTSLYRVSIKFNNPFRKNGVIYETKPLYSHPGQQHFS